MVGGNWTNGDGLFLQYGTSKATATTMGDYLSYGETREIEFTLTPSSLTTSPVIQGNTTMLPTGVFIEEIETAVENVAPAGGTSISIGTMRADRTTGISNVNILNAQVLASHDAVGETNTYNVASAGGGGALLGTVTNFTDGFAYITALCAGTYTGAGTIKVRIKYRGLPPITK
jgi:hypothetical protein